MFDFICLRISAAIEVRCVTTIAADPSLKQHSIFPFYDFAISGTASENINIF